MAARKKVTKTSSKATAKPKLALKRGATARSTGTETRSTARAKKPVAQKDAAKTDAAKTDAKAHTAPVKAAAEGTVAKPSVSAKPAVSGKPVAVESGKPTMGKAKRPDKAAAAVKPAASKPAAAPRSAKAKSEPVAAPAAEAVNGRTTAAETPQASTPEMPAARPAEMKAQQTGPAKATKETSPPKPMERTPTGGEQKAMKSNNQRNGFKLNEYVVYPAHGVGQITAVEEQEVAGFRLELFVISFVKDKMTLRVPTSKVAGVGMRKLSDPESARRSLEILTGRARVKRTMWSRRAQEYEAKINSGDINAIAEVVRDLFRSEAQPEQSYSERQLYEAALDRMMREIAVVQKLSEAEALKVIDAQLKKNTKRGVKADGAEGEEAGIEEAA